MFVVDYDDLDAAGVEKKLSKFDDAVKGMCYVMTFQNLDHEPLPMEVHPGQKRKASKEGPGGLIKRLQGCALSALSPLPTDLVE